MNVDSLIALRMLYKLVTPFDQMPAYNMGIIDGQGNFIKRVDMLSPEERSQISTLDIMAINLKRLIGKLPGGSSKIASYAAALWLTKPHNVYEDNNIEAYVEKDFTEYFNKLQEDGVAINSVSAGGVYGTQPGEVIVTPKAAKKYKEKNAKAADTIRRVLGKVPSTTPVQESTLEYHRELNPKIWENGQLKGEVKGKLIQIANEWRMFAKIPEDMVKDIIITGGNVNYNYTPMSDIDLHLVIDRDAFNPSREFTDEYLQDKKILWTFSHQGISIYGYPVELYAQDINDRPHMGQGVYSIMSNQWLQMPEYLGLDFENDYHLQQKVEHYKDLIDKMIRQNASGGTIDMIKTRIRQMRGDSIAKGGEFAFGNLVFKELRNQGYLDKMNDYEKTMQDKALSLESLNVEFSKINP